MKIGVIGCGGMGTTHYLSLKALSAQMDVEVTALADCRQEFLERAAAHFPGVHTYKEGMELIESESLDVVHICLPSYLHAEYAIAAMKKGMHVFVEKPLCLTMEEGKALLEAEKKYGVKAMVGQVIRSYDEYLFLKDAYDTNKYGKLKSMVMQRISGDVSWGFEDWFHDEKRSGSVVLDLHVHDLDFLRYMLGEPDTFTVKATAFDSGMINQIITSYEFGDVFVTAEGVWNVCDNFPFEASFRANFEEAVVCFNGTKKPTLTVYKKNGEVEHPDLSGEYNVSDDSAGINVSNLGPYYAEIKYFLQCLQKQEPVERAPLCEGLKSVELAIKELEAAKAYIKNKKS